MPAPPRATGGRVQPHSHGPRIPRFKQSQVPSGLNGRPELVMVRTEALFGPLSAGVIGLLLEPPKPLGGGGIEPTGRPGRRPLTPYRSPETLGLELSFILDGLAENESVERECRAIEVMAGMFLPDDPGPQRLIVQGKSVPHCRGAAAFRRRWLIANAGDDIFADDPEVIRRDDGDRLRQAVSLTLYVATDTDELERARPRQSRPNYRLVSAKEGDTYEKVAARELDSRRLGGRLAKLNGKRDPTTKLKEGQRVRLPSAHLLAEWKRDLKGGR